MNKFKFLSSAFIFSASLLSIQATATAASIQANANARMIVRIQITETAELHFGTIAAPTTTSTVRITQGGTRSVQSGDAGLVTGVSPDVAQAAAFDITGEPNRAVDINVPQASINASGPGMNMSVGTFDFPATATLDGSGNASFNLGADLTINPNQTTGSYSGTYTMQVNYQ